MEGFGDRAQAFAEAGRPLRHDHEFLEVNRRVGVRAAVEHVDHGHGQDLGIGAAEVFEERLAERRGGGLRVGERDAENGVGAELGFGFGAVEIDHDAVHRQLVKGVDAHECGGDLGR